MAENKGYVESEALKSWESQMKSINEQCLADIDTISKQVDSLKDGFKGDYSDSYTEAFNELLSSIKTSHEALSNFSSFLNTVVETVENMY